MIHSDDHWEGASPPSLNGASFPVYLERLFLPRSVLQPEEQLGTLQLLIYLLPPCNCDTLHRLLQFLAIVARHANDNISKDGQEVCTPLLLQMLWLFLLPVLKGHSVDLVKRFTWKKWHLSFPHPPVYVGRTNAGFALEGQFLKAHRPLTSCVSRMLPFVWGKQTMSYRVLTIMKKTE